MLFKAGATPFSERSDHFVMVVAHLEAFAKEGARDELIFWREALGMEESPAAIVAHISCDLELASEGAHVGTMDANDLAAPLANRQVIEFLGEADQ
jgi:hypothetical protein